jgi:outer membrane receptor protein involved in Fe transport
MNLKKVLMYSPTLVLSALMLLSPAWAEESEAVGEYDIEEVVVEATRSELTMFDIPVNTSILDQQDISESSTKPVDEILRQIPGFSMLRSADSIASSPTTNTVSLRGLGGSAASRTLVLLDGIPIHNPFSSEVYWSRVPKHQIGHIEVVRGGGANAWGNLSLGGVINIVMEKPRQDGLDFTAAIGYPQSMDLAVSGSQVTEKWSLSGSASYFDTDGYMSLPLDQQGPIDEEVRKNHGVLSGKAAFQLNDNTRFHLNGSWFEEDRTAGTPLDNNTIENLSLGAGIETNTGGGSQWKFNLFYDDSNPEDYSVSVNDDRDEENIRAFRAQPASTIGSGLVWSRRLGENHSLTAGVDYRWTDVTIDEFGRYRDGAPRQLKTTTGSQDMGGVFIQDIWQISEHWQVNGSLRYDYVSNSGELVVRDLTNDSIDSTKSYDSNSEDTVNPSIGAIYAVNEDLSLRGAVYKGFRAATMRELYRSDSTRGGVNVVNNPYLAPERLVGMEAGADFMISDRATLRLTVFQNTVQDLIQNITRGVAGETPEIIEPCGLIGAHETCRELDNVGEMEATGFELETAYHPVENWSFFLSYLYNDTEISSAPDNPHIVGNQVRQAPEHSFTVRARNSNRWFDTSMLARYVGERFEDDVNTLPVDDFLLFDLRFSRQINHSTELYLTIENLLDEEYEIRTGNDGSIEIGRPRYVWLGLQFSH